MKGGKVANSSFFVLRYIDGQIDKRVSVVAPVKIAKTAVSRNKARRRMYSALRITFPSIMTGIHAIIFARNDLSKYSFNEISDDIKILLNKAHILSIAK